LSKTSSADALIDVGSLTQLTATVLAGTGITIEDAELVAHSLVAADVEGVPSHGVALLPLYVERLNAGGVVANAVPAIVEDLGGLVVMSAGHVLGQISSKIAVDLAAERAKSHGISMVTVRNGFHFGTAGFWAKALAVQGMIGLAFSNTRPLMPAPGGAQAVVGNNPIAVAFPSTTGAPVVVDMAMSATAMGKIRLADAKGEDIPLGWATDANGRPTTDPAEAIKGMLLPAAGPKGFGLAVAIDLLCGALSGGAFGSAVKPMYGNPAEHYDCSHAFIAIDAQQTGSGSGIGAAVASLANQIRQSDKAPGTPRIFAPGDIEQACRAERQAQCPLPKELVKQLNQLAQQVGSTARL
jgi:LDH2 family malate/lactate/ureidoglycolate dehydrogenase